MPLHMEQQQQQKRTKINQRLYSCQLRVHWENEIVWWASLPTNELNRRCHFPKRTNVVFLLQIYKCKRKWEHVADTVINAILPPYLWVDVLPNVKRNHTQAGTCSFFFILSKVCESKVKQSKAMQIKRGHPTVRHWCCVQTTKNTERKIHIRSKELWRVGNLLHRKIPKWWGADFITVCLLFNVYVFTFYSANIWLHRNGFTRSAPAIGCIFFCLSISRANRFAGSTRCLECFKKKKITIIIIKRPFTRF